MAFQKDLSVLLAVKKHQRNIKAGENSCNHEVIASLGIQGSRICQLKKENHSLISMCHVIIKCVKVCTDLSPQVSSFFSHQGASQFQCFQDSFLRALLCFLAFRGCLDFSFLEIFLVCQKKENKSFSFATILLIWCMCLTELSLRQRQLWWVPLISFLCWASLDCFLLMQLWTSCASITSMIH